MRLALRVLAIAGLSFGAACTDGATAPLGSKPLIGTWATTEESGGGPVVTSYTFASDGSFLLQQQLFGLYPGQSRGDLSAYARVAGVYAVSGGEVLLYPKTTETWDRANGARSRPQTTTLAEPLPERDPYVLRGDSLSLTTVSYPADAPVTTTRTYLRQRCTVILAASTIACV